jgi:Na+-transporting NADH:ubiquinone oxidoreductase subunit NqrC
MFALKDEIGKIIWVSFIILIISVIFIKIYFFLNREKIIIENFTENNQILVSSEQYPLKIKTFEIKKIFINNKEYFIDENGELRTELPLFNGMNIFFINWKTESNHESSKKIYIFKENSEI